MGKLNISRRVSVDFKIDTEKKLLVIVERESPERETWQYYKFTETGSITINNVVITGDVLIQTLNQMTDPDPKKWFRFERHGNTVTVHTRIDDDQTPNHNPDLPSVLG